MTERTLLAAIDSQGWGLLHNAFSAAECAALIAGIEAALARCVDDSSALRRRGGALYGARNLLELYPPTRETARNTACLELLTKVLGPQAGLVRAIYFDKPPTATWSLPWHQDRTIAVEENRLPSKEFQLPTMKAGVPHIEAPRAVLERMLTLRIHLDAATPDNGPLQVISGSHRSDGESVPETGQGCSILAEAGDVLAMRPLLLHCSGVSTPGTVQHRRIVHLEFAADAQLPDGFAWHTFLPIVGVA